MQTSVILQKSKCNFKGKTSLLVRFAEDAFNEHSIPTIGKLCKTFNSLGIDFKIKVMMIDDVVVKVVGTLLLIIYLIRPKFGILQDKQGS